MDAKSGEMVAMSKAGQAVLYCDVVESSRLFSVLGDVVAEAKIRFCLDRVGEIVRSHAGWEVKRLGDEVMAVFPSSMAAAKAAIEMQIASAEFDGTKFRIGFAIGDLVLRNRDVFGKAVICAKRLVDLAPPDHVLTTAEVAVELMARGLPELCLPYDRLDLKGIGPTTVMRVLWDPNRGTQAIATIGNAPDALAAIGWIDLGVRKIEIRDGLEPLSVGRDAGALISFPGMSQVSRQHAVLFVSRGKLMLRDHSTNGTWFYPSEDAAGGVRAGSLVRHEVVQLRGQGRVFFGSQEGEGAAWVTYRMFNG